MDALQWDDVAWAVRRLPFIVRSLLQRHGVKLFLAGGYLRAVIAGERVNDIDLFAPSKDYAEACAKELAAGDPKKKPRRLLETENAYTVFCKPFPMQFIHRWTFDRPEDALASFDFTVAQAAIWWDATSWHSLCGPRFYADLAAKRLVYTKPQRDEAPGGSMLRVLKFYQRGYRIPLDSLGAVIARLAGGVKQFSGHDSAVIAPLLTGLLREVDPLIDPNHVAHLPSADDGASDDEGMETNDAAEAPQGA